MKVKDLPKNQPAPPVPPWFIKALVERFGRNRYHQPNVVIEWGMDANIYIDGIPRIKAEYLKYRAQVFHSMRPLEPGSLILQKVYQQIDIGTPCFFACDWWPPELLGKKTWDEKMFGEFPAMGQHRSFLKLTNEKGEAMMPGRQMFEKIEYVYALRDRQKELHSIEEGDDEFNEKQEIQKKLNAENAHWDAFWKKHEDAMYQEMRPHIHRLLTNTPNRGQIGRRYTK